MGGMHNFLTHIFQHYIPYALNSLTGTVRNLLCNLDISKNHKKATTPNEGSHFGADLGAIWRRKRSKDVFSSIWDRFGSIFNRFLTIFDGFVLLFLMDLLVDFGRIFDEF